MIYTFGDEMHACAWWYTIAFAMDKKSTGRNLSIFGADGGIRTHVGYPKLISSQPRYDHFDTSALYIILLILRAE